MKSEFDAVKSSQSEAYRFSQEQLDHVYEFIKVNSKKLDDTFNVLDARFIKIEGMQAKILGGIAVIGFLIPVAVTMMLYIVEHR